MVAVIVLLADPVEEAATLDGATTTTTLEEPVAKVETAMVVTDVTGAIGFHSGLLVIIDVTMVVLAAEDEAMVVPAAEDEAMVVEAVEFLDPTEEEDGNTTIAGEDKEAIRDV